MKLVIATEIFPPTPGGMATWLDRTIPGLVKRGFDIEVVTFGDPDGLADLGVPVTCIKQSIMLPQRLWKYYKVLKNKVRGADVVLVMGSVLSGVPAAFVKRKTNVPMVMRSGGDFVWEKAQAWWGITDAQDVFYAKTYSFIIEWLKRVQAWAVGYMDHVYANSRYQQDVVIDQWQYRKPTNVIYTGLELPQDFSITREEARKKLKLSGEIILGVGRLIYLKGWKELLHNSSEWLREKKDRTLVILGDGPEREKLKQSVSDLRLDKHVRFEGHVAQSAIHTYFAAADVYISYAQFEALSNAMVEAVMHRLPIIATRKGGNTEVLEQYGFGQLVLFNDKEALHEALQQVPGMQLNQERTAHFQKLFSYDAMLESVVETLEKTAKANKILSVLTVGVERGLVDPTSLASKRAIEYGKQLGRYAVVIPGDKAQQVDLADNVHVYAVTGHGKLQTYIHMWRQLWRLAASGKYTVISSQDPFEFGFMALCIARWFGLGVEVQEHGDFYHGPYWQQESKLNTVRAFMGRLVLPRADSVRVVSQRVKRHVMKLGVAGDRISVIPISAPAPYQPDDSVQLKESDDHFIFLTIGRFVKQKNLGMMVRAFAQVAVKHAQARLVLTGKGPEEPMVRSLIRELKMQDKVRIDHWTDSVYEYYKQTDCYLLTSHYEGWGRVIVEAAFLELPVIMTPVGVASEVLQHEKSALLAPREDADAFARTMERLMLDQDLQKRLAREALKRVQALPSREQMLPKYVASWRKAAK